MRLRDKFKEEELSIDHSLHLQSAVRYKSAKFEAVLSAAWVLSAAAKWLYAQVLSDYMCAVPGDVKCWPNNPNTPAHMSHY